MPNSLSDLQQLRTVLGRLNAERRAVSQPRENQTTYVKRADKLHRRLSLEIESQQGKARVLLTGQIGVGKSSELFRFVHEQREQARTNRQWIIACDLERQEHPERCSATGVLLTIFRDCWASGMSKTTDLHKLKPLRKKILEKLIDWLNGERTSTESEVVFKFGGMNFSVFLNRPNDALSLILGKAAQHEAVSESTERFGIIPDTLLNLLNEFLDWLSRGHARAPLIVVDHVDKIRDASAAEDVLLKAVPQWDRIRASIVMTAPYEHTLGVMRDSIESRWGRPLMLYPVDIAARDVPFDTHQPDPIFLEIVKNAGLLRLAEVQAVSYLTYYSGGILRNFVSSLREACKQVYMNGEDKITRRTAESVVQSARQSYNSYSISELKLLSELEIDNTGLGHAATVLRSPIGLLVNLGSDGEEELRVHPLAELAVSKYRRRLTKAW